MRKSQMMCVCAYEYLINSLWKLWVQVKWICVVMSNTRPVVTIKTGYLHRTTYLRWNYFSCKKIFNVPAPIVFYDLLYYLKSLLGWISVVKEGANYLNEMYYQWRYSTIKQSSIAKYLWDVSLRGHF